MPVLLQLSGVIVDLVYRVDSVPPAGSEAIVHDLTLAAGGGFNAMQAARQAGMEVSYAGACGTGPLSDLVRQALAAEQIAITQPIAIAIDQGCCTTLVDNAGERTFIAKEGAEGQLSRQHLATVLAAPQDWVLVSGYAMGYPGSRDVIAEWLAELPAEIPLVFDPCPMVERIPEDILLLLLSKAWWVSANAAEAEFLTRIGDPAEAARCLLNMQQQNFPQREGRSRQGGVVIRLGAEGCLVATPDGAINHCAGFSVETVDSSGAGDTHVGTFISRLASGSSAVEAADFANAAAALATTRHGPATAVEIKEVQQFLRSTSTVVTRIKIPNEKGRQRPRKSTRPDSVGAGTKQ